MDIVDRVGCIRKKCLLIGADLRMYIYRCVWWIIFPARVQYRSSAIGFFAPDPTNAYRTNIESLEVSILNVFSFGLRDAICPMHTNVCCTFLIICNMQNAWLIRRTGFFLIYAKSTESLSHRMVLRFISKTFCNIVLFLKIAIYIQYRICVLYVALSA